MAAIKIALEQKLRRVSARRWRTVLLKELASIRRRCDELPILDARVPENLVGYDEDGLPR